MPILKTSDSLRLIRQFSNSTSTPYVRRKPFFLHLFCPLISDRTWV